MAFESISPQNGSSASPRSFDAIVVGGGASGGVAALTLGEAGLNVLVLDAGWDLSFTDTPWRWFENYVLSRSADPRLMDVLPATVIRRARQLARLGGRIRQPIQSQCYAWERLPGVFVDDIDHPYETRGGADFSWLRVHALGGRMIVPGHGRQYYRFPGNVFRPTTNEKPAWPMSLEELVPHYEAIERRLKLSGDRRRRNPHCTSVVEDPLQPTGDEQDLLNVAKACASDADPMLSQFAAPLNTIAMAGALPSVRIRRGALVRHVTANGSGRVNGVTWYDREEDRILEASAPIVFLCAGALESTRILMTSAEVSTSSAFGSRSTALGRNLMDHVIMKADGVGAELRDPSFHPPDGRCVYVPNVSEGPSADSSDGFSLQLYRAPSGKKSSYFAGVAFAEMMPRPENRVRLSATRRDRFGAPVLEIECRHSDREREVALAQARVLKDLARRLDVKLITEDLTPSPPGQAIHECGVARMGDDPLTSVLNPNNECWDAKGLFVTDASCFVTQGLQSPTLTIMALTRRACLHAISTV